MDVVARKYSSVQNLTQKKNSKKKWIPITGKKGESIGGHYGALGYANGVLENTANAFSVDITHPRFFIQNGFFVGNFLGVFLVRDNFLVQGLFLKFLWRLRGFFLLKIY